MKKVFLLLTALIIITGCVYVSENMKPRENGNEFSEEESIIVPEGSTLETRIRAPYGFFRSETEEGSLTAYLRNYKMKAHSLPVLLYDGSEKGNQSAHAAVFDFPLENADLQQCADSVMRIFAEYYWEKGEHEKISFHFTDGFLCEYSKWKEGYRVVFDGGKTAWRKTASYDASYECFAKYMRIVFSYAGTASMAMYESETIPLYEAGVGDVVLKGGSPGHVVMVVDVCENEAGEKAFLLAQGHMPAQEFHIINNPAHAADPWYYESELSFPLETAEYVFADDDMIKRLSY